MTKEKIIDYIMETPHNTNPAILSQMLDEVAGEGGEDGYLGFHTATVNVTFDTSEISGEVTAIDSAYVYLLGINNSYAVEFFYNDSAIPVIELGTPTQMQIPILGDYPTLIDAYAFTWLNTTLDKLLLEEITVVSGEATQIDECHVYITGDCSLNIKVKYQGDPK